MFVAIVAPPALTHTVLLCHVLSSPFDRVLGLDIFENAGPWFVALPIVR